MKRIGLSLVFIFVCTQAFATITPFESSRQKEMLQRSLESALAEKNKSAFALKARQAAELVYAQWEKEALHAYEKMQKQGLGESGATFESLKSDAQGSIALMLLEAEGRFDARCAEIVMPEFAKEELLAKIRQMSEQSPLEDIVAAYYAWDEVVGVYVQELLFGINSELEQNRQEALADIVQTAEAYKDGFIREIDIRITALKKEAYREIELYYIGARNAYMTTHFADTKSLRRESEQQSAEAITENILTQTQGEALALSQQVEEKLAYTVCGISVPQTDDIEALVRAGIYAWKAAEDKLIAARFEWERTALTNYDLTNEAWAVAFEKLTQRRNEWYTDIQRQIRQGIINWQETFLETDSNFADALKLLDETIQTEKERFDDYSASIRDLIVTGSSSLKIAYENVGWLREYSQSLSDSNVSQVKQAVDEQIQNWNAIISRYNELVARSALQYHQQDMWSTQKIFVQGEFAALYTDEATDLAKSEEIFKKLFAAIREGKIGNNLQAMDVFAFTDELCTQLVTIQFVYLLSEGFVPFNDAFGKLIERYGSKAEQYKDNLAAVYNEYCVGTIGCVGGKLQARRGSIGWIAARLDNFRQFVICRHGSFEALFGYTTTGSGLLADNRYDEEGNPLYQFYWYQDKNGVVLINDDYPVTHDPYLMTQAEFELEKEKLTLAYWEERYQRAQKLYDYAYNEAERPDAKTQKEKLQQAIDSYNTAKQDYTNAMERLKGELKDALITAQQDVDRAKKVLDDMRIAYESAQKYYQDAVEKCLMYTNPLSREMAIQMVQEAASTIIQIKNRIQNKEKKLFDAKLDYYKALILSERHRNTAEYATRVEKVIRALEGTVEVQGFRNAYDVWNSSIAAKNTIDDCIIAIEENADALYVNVENLFPENPDDEAIGFLTQGLKRRQVAKEIYEQAVEVYNQWKQIYVQDDSKSKAHEMVVYILRSILQNSEEGKELQAGVTWAMIQEQLEYVLSDNTTIQDNAITLLQEYSAGLMPEEELRDIIAKYDGLNGDEIQETIEALLLTNVLIKVYGIDARAETEEGFIYAPCTELYYIFETILNKQYTDAASQLRRAIANVGQTIHELYEVSKAVAEYCLKDMRNEDLETSPYTKDNILKAAKDAEKRSGGDYFAITQSTLGIVKSKLERYRQEASGEQEGKEQDRTLNGNDIFDEMYALCRDKIEKGTFDEGLQHAYMLTVLSSMEQSLRAVTTVAKLDEILQQVNQLIQDLDVVRDVYINEVSECSDDAALKELITKYSSMIESEKDSNGNDLTEDEKQRAKIALMALVHPEMYDMVRPGTDESQRHAYVMTEYARYVEKFYESSLEYYRRVKEEGFIGTIARILGISKADDVAQELSGQITVEKLLDYGAKAENFIQDKEFGKLPQALREALLSVVDRYHALLAKKALYDNRNTTEDDARNAYQQAETVYQKLIELQKKYGELIELRRNMYSDEINSYTQKRDAYYAVVPKGIWPGYTDEMIVIVRQCEAIYNEVKEYINNTAFHTIQATILAQLSNLEKIRYDYEVVDYTARYLADEIGAYGSLDEYCQHMRSQGKSEEFVATVRTEIEKQLAKRKTVQRLLKNEITPSTVSEDDRQWVLAAYYAGIQSSVGDVQNFNAFTYDSDFVRYALGLHFQVYVNKALQSDAVPSLKELFGYINSDTGSFIAGSFATLAQYSTPEAIEYFKIHYDAFSALYYETLTHSLLAKAYTIQNASVFTNPKNEQDILAHFLAYCIELADDDGTINYDFTEVFGDNNGANGGFEASGFTQLTPYCNVNMQQYFADHYELFKQLFIWIQNDTAALSLAWLPEGVREYALQREYYLQRKEGVIVDSVERLFAYYGVDTDNDEMRSNVEDFVKLTTIALEWDRQTPLQQYLDEHNITDEKERNYVILASLYPELADPVNLIVSDSQVPLVLTGLQMQNAENILYDTLTKEDENGLQSLLGLCIYAAGRDKTIAYEVYRFILTTRDRFVHYRDYLPLLKAYYEEYAVDNDTPGPFKDFIINDVEALKDRKLVKIENTDTTNNWYGDIDLITQWYNSLTPEDKQFWAGLYEHVINEYRKHHSVDYRYYDDANSNGKYDEGEKYLADFLDEYRAQGYGLIIENKKAADIGAIAADAVGTDSNSIGYFEGDSRSYFNAILEEASTMALQLEVLVKVAQWAVEESSGFVFTEDKGQQIDVSYVQDYYAFIDGINIGGDSSEEENNGERLSFDEIQEYLVRVIQNGSDARVSELVQRMRDKNDGLEKALIDAYTNIEKMGIILENKTLEEYLNSSDFIAAKEKYTNEKKRFEDAQNELHNALNAYSKAQDEYSRQLEIISILYTRLDEARKLKEDEELLYAYASNPYLYNSETNAEGGDVGVSKLKVDVRQQFELAQKYRDEVQKRIEQLKQKVEEVKNQNVENDEQYITLRDELRERAQRAYRMEKLAMCMQNEIKQLAVAYDEAKEKYETSKNAFLQATRKEYENERDRLVDRMIEEKFVNGFMIMNTPLGDITLSTLVHHLNTAAYYYDKHHSWYGRSRIITTEPWLGSIPGGDGIVTMNSPLYEYLMLMRKDDKKIHESQYINEYFDEFLKARNYENKYDNFLILYLGTYETLYKPHKKVYDYLYNKTIKVLGKKIYPLRNISKSYYKTVLTPIVAILDVMYKQVREAERHMKTHNNSAKSALNNIRAKLTQLQNQKIAMLKAKANLAKYIEIESVDDPETAGAFVYYNPKTMQKVVVKKPTLKDALREIAKKYEIAIQDSDLEYLVTAERGGDYVNVSRFTNIVTKTDENGYETDQTMQVYHAGNVSQTYADIINDQRRDCLARYINYTKTMYTQKDYDRVIIDRAVEKELFKQFAEDKQSALQIGVESKGTIRAMIAYMGYVEGIPVTLINELDEMIGGDSEGEVSSKFAQYVKQYEGINDRELKQRRDLQVHKWQLTKKLLQDKKDDWDRMVNRIFERGVRQWDMMLQAFVNRWKNWQNDTKDKIAAGNREWDARMKQLQEAKFQWFSDAQKGMSAKELHKRLSSLEVTLNELLSHMKEKYGDTIGKVDVHAMLLEILKDQPALLSEEVMALTKTKVEFGLTQLTTRKYNRGLFNEANQLAQEFAVAQQKTQNLQLLKTLTELLKRCREQLEAANEQAGLSARQFVSAYDFSISGDKYKRTLPVSKKEQVIKAYRPFVYSDSLVLGTYTIPGLMQLYQNDDGVVFNATMTVVLSQVQTRMRLLYRPDITWGFSYYTGEFGEIQYDGGKPKLKKEGKGEYGRITRDVYKAQKEKAIEDAVCQYVNAGIGVALSIATANPLVGAAYMSWQQSGGLATGDVSFTHWAMQTGISVGASAFGGYMEGLTQSAAMGALGSSTVQGLGNFVEYKTDGSLGVHWGSKQQWRNFGIGAVTSMVGASINANSNYSASVRYAYNVSSSFLVNRFDGKGSWQEDLFQSGASVAALYVSDKLLAFAGSNNTIGAMAPTSRFIQGTLENILLATGGMWIGSGKTDSFAERMLAQNWGKTQYTVADYLSEYAARIAQKQAEAARNMRNMERLDALAGLGWLGTRMGQIFESAWDEVGEWIENIFEKHPKDTAALQRQKDIEESKMMWESGQMQKEIDKNILAREDKYAKEIQNSYTEKDIRKSDDNKNNIKVYNGGSAEMYERLAYYEALMRAKGFSNFEELLEEGIPIVIGEEGKGAGLQCTNGKGKPTGDTYNDRITKIYKDKDGNIHIEEYYRANVDVSHTTKNPSVAQGEYNFVVGMHGRKNKVMALNIFKNNKERLEQIISSIKDKEQRKEIWEALDKNEIRYSLIKGDTKLRTLTAVGGKTQIGINLHGGSNSSTDSLGCFTIYGMDWKNNSPQKDYKQFLETFRKNQLGKLYLIR